MTKRSDQEIRDDAERHRAEDFADSTRKMGNYLRVLPALLEVCHSDLIVPDNRVLDLLLSEDYVIEVNGELIITHKGFQAGLGRK